jgi:hypothetical protein
MRRKDHKEITAAALEFQYPAASRSLLNRVALAVQRAERLVRRSGHPERHALRVPFADMQDSLDLIRLHYQELLLRLADADAHHQLQRMERCFGQCLHLLQDLALYSDLYACEDTERRAIISDIISGYPLKVSLQIYAAPEHSLIPRVSDPYTIPDPFSRERQAAATALAVELSRAFIAKHSPVIDTILSGQSGL